MEYRASAIFVRQSTMDFPSYLRLLFRLIMIRVMGEHLVKVLILNAGLQIRHFEKKLKSKKTRNSRKKLKDLTKLIQKKKEIKKILP